MTELFPTMQDDERAYLVGVQIRGARPVLSLADSLDELGLLATTAGMQVVGRNSQTLSAIDPATFIGSGKVAEIQEEADEIGATAIIFDDELSPRHEKELSRIFGEKLKVLDRSALILDIFAQHARTREGALQVELAQYEYRLPRLTRQWTHLARQAGGRAGGNTGGVGVRGPGETQLEVDRREIGRKIAKLKEEIERVREQRSQHRVQRRKTGIPVVALVGYTNAGKSTLLNSLTNAGVYVADQLFATLDPTTRRIMLPSGREVLVTDTVGFIQKLPATLIAAFRATLEEITESDLILHVVDGSHPNVMAHIEVVEDTLAEIEVPDIPHILVWNKSDQKSVIDAAESPEFADYDSIIRLSALRRTGIDALLSAIDEALAKSVRRETLMIPYERGDLVSQLYREARVIRQEHGEKGALIEVEIPQSIRDRFVQYISRSKVHATED